MLATVGPDDVLVQRAAASTPDVEQRAALASAEQVISAVTEKIGTPILRLLLHNLVRNASCTDAHRFLQKVADGELFAASLSRPCPPVPADKASSEPARGMPQGWVRCGLWHPDFEQNYGDWSPGFHGTNADSLLKILLGGLQQPGQDGVRVRHGQTHSSSGCSIYASPSLEYAAFPCYANFVPIGSQHWAQFVLECRLRPGGFRARHGTLSSNKHWPGDVSIDPAFAGTRGLEWLVEDPNDIIVSAVLLREFGPEADASLYGDMATRVRKGPRGPEYTWTQLRVFFTRAGSDLDDTEELLMEFGASDELLDQWKALEVWLLQQHPGGGQPALAPELRRGAVSFLTSLVCSAGLLPQHAFQALTLLDGLCMRRGAEAVVRQLPGTCAVLVRILLKEESQVARAPKFTREVAAFTKTLQVNGLPVAEAQDLLTLEPAVLAALEWRVSAPSICSWLSCFASRLNVLSKGVLIPWVEVALDWSMRRAGDIARRQAASADLAPRHLAAGLLMLVLVSVGLFPEEEFFLDLAASAPLKDLDCSPAQASDRNLDVQQLCKAMHISKDELMEASIAATSVIIAPSS